MFTVRSLIVSLVVLVALFEVVASKEPAFNRAFKLMEAYAAGQTPTSGLGLKDIEEAAKEFHGWSPKLKAEARLAPTIRCFIDFVITPIASIHHQVGPDYVDHFIKRAERVYKEFRPAYVELKTFPVEAARCDRTNELLEAFREGTQDKVTIKQLLAAKAELETWRARLDEITMYDDIYACTDELKKLFTYFNGPLVQVLYTDVFPTLTPKTNPKEAMETYARGMLEKHRIVARKGQFVRLADPRRNLILEKVDIKRDSTPNREVASSEGVDLSIP